MSSNSYSNSSAPVSSQGKISWTCHSLFKYSRINHFYKKSLKYSDSSHITSTSQQNKKISSNKSPPSHKHSLTQQPSAPTSKNHSILSLEKHTNAQLAVSLYHSNRYPIIPQSAHSILKLMSSNATVTSILMLTLDSTQQWQKIPTRYIYTFIKLTPLMHAMDKILKLVGWSLDREHIKILEKLMCLNKRIKYCANYHMERQKNTFTSHQRN